MKFLTKALRGVREADKSDNRPVWQISRPLPDSPAADPAPPDPVPIDEPRAGDRDLVDLDLGDLQDMELLPETQDPQPEVPVRNSGKRPAISERPRQRPAVRARTRIRGRSPDTRSAPPAPAARQPGPGSSSGADVSAQRAEGWLTTRDLRRSFSGRPVVQDVSLAVRRGEAVGLLGPNGAGKTTLFYMITGLIRADSGIITLDGRDVTRLPMYRRARLGIGYLPQESSIFRGLNVEDNIRAVLQVVEPNRKKRQLELDALLDEFGIGHLRKSPSIALSGGERRRCEIARALASRPSFMLLDEPFAGIDPIAVGDIQGLVRHLTARGIGILVTDHNVRETLGLVDRAYILHTGRVLTEGTPGEIIENPDVRRVYLGDRFSL